MPKIQTNIWIDEDVKRETKIRHHNFSGHVEELLRQALGTESEIEIKKRLKELESEEERIEEEKKLLTKRLEKFNLVKPVIIEALTIFRKKRQNMDDMVNVEWADGWLPEIRKEHPHIKSAWQLLDILKKKIKEERIKEGDVNNGK